MGHLPTPGLSLDYGRLRHLQYSIHFDRNQAWIHHDSSIRSSPDLDVTSQPGSPLGDAKDQDSDNNSNFQTRTANHFWIIHTWKTQPSPGFRLYVATVG